MSKFAGYVGFMMDEIETAPGIWTSGEVRKYYKGEMINFAQDNSNQTTVNSEVKIRAGVKIFANEFAKKNLSRIRYVEICGVKWEVNSITPQYPRLVLSLGGEYKLNDQS